jgi:hypothetical protein
MSDKRIAEIEVDDGYPMTDLEIELLQALKTERELFKVYREFMLLTTEPRKAAQE